MTVAVVIAGLLPGLLLLVGEQAGLDLLRAEPYVAATGLGGTP